MSESNNALQSAQRIIREQNCWSLLYSGLPAVVFLLWICCKNIDTREINLSLLSLNADFGITLSAFALTALSIIYALPNREITQRFRKTPGYLVVLLAFKQAIILCLINFVMGYAGKLIVPYLGIQLNQIITSASLFLIILGAIWIYWCMRNIFTVLLLLK